MPKHAPRAAQRQPVLTIWGRRPTRRDLPAAIALHRATRVCPRAYTLVAPRPLDHEFIFTARLREADDCVEAFDLDTDFLKVDGPRLPGGRRDRGAVKMLNSQVEQVRKGEAHTFAEQRVAERRAMWPRAVLRIREMMSDCGLTVDDIGFDRVRERRVLTKAEQAQAAPSYPTPWLTPVAPKEGEDPDVWYNRYSCAQLTALETCERLICTYDLTIDQVIHTKLGDAVKIKPAAKRDALIEASRLWRVFRISRKQFWDDIP